MIRSTQELMWERGYVETSPKAIQRVAEAGRGVCITISMAPPTGLETYAISKSRE